MIHSVCYYCWVQVVYFIYGNQGSIVQQDVLQSWLELSLEVTLVGLKTVVALRSCSRTQQANIEHINMRTQSLVGSLHQLVEVTFVSEIVEGGETDGLGLEE